MIVKNGAILTYQGTWPKLTSVSGLWTPVSQVISEITAALNGDGLSVLSESDQGTGILAFSDTFQITLKIQNNTGQDFGSEGDVVSIIRHEVFTRVGNFPISDSVPTIQQPGVTAPVITGQPGPTSSPSGIGQSLSDLFSGFASNTQLVVIGAGLGLVAAVLLISRPRVSV